MIGSIKEPSEAVLDATCLHEQIDKDSQTTRQTALHKMTNRLYRTRISVDKSYHRQSEAVIEVWSKQRDGWSEVARLLPSRIDKDIHETESRLLELADIVNP